MSRPRTTSFTFELDAGQQAAVRRELRQARYEPAETPHANVSAVLPGPSPCRIVLYRSGKLVVQGAGAEDWVLYVLEPSILRRAGTGYEAETDPARAAPHMGVDESGKGDFFGPMVVAAAYVDSDLLPRFEQLNVRDSKRVGSDAAALRMAAELRRLLGRRLAVVTIGPRAYNRLYARFNNVNAILAWGHARAIEDLLAAVPDCSRAISDQFGPANLVRRALMQRGRSIELEQRPRAESDPAVAAASILARAAFVAALRRLGETHGFSALKGASAQVEAAAVELVRRQGAAVLLDVAKCHFQTTDRVLAAAGWSREELGELGQARSRSRTQGDLFS